MRRSADATLILLFLALLGVPTARNFAGSPAAAAPDENRTLAPRPEWPRQWAGLEQYPLQFEAFYNDHFGYRRKLIDWLNNMRVRWLQSSSSPRVCLGKEGWLYYEYEPLGNDYTTHRPFTVEELERWRRILESRRDWLKERGIPYIFLIAPDKQSIYPEMLPRVLRRRARHSSKLDQLCNYLKENSDVEVLDLREPLRLAKTQRRVFFISDSHWNDHGAYVAYCVLICELAKHWPALQPAPRTEFMETTVRLPGGDLAKMLGLRHLYVEDHDLLVPRSPRLSTRIETGARAAHLPPQMQPSLLVRPGPELPRAVLFHDSFAKCFTPFLAEHFQRLCYRWLEPYEFDAELIEQERPDVVIQQIVERKLRLPFPADCRAGLDDTLGPSETRTASVGKP